MIDRAIAFYFCHPERVFLATEGSKNSIERRFFTPFRMSFSNFQTITGGSMTFKENAIALTWLMGKLENPKTDQAGRIPC